MSRRQASKSVPRGYFGIGIEDTKTPANVGCLWRSAHLFGAAFIFTVGHRYPSKFQPTDTMKTASHTPLLEFDDVIDAVEHRPRGATVVGIELADDACPLPRFVHPERAFYLLGAEDHGLSDDALKRCDVLVQIPTLLPYSMNVAVAGSIVIADRFAKGQRLV